MPRCLLRSSARCWSAAAGCGATWQKPDGTFEVLDDPRGLLKGGAADAGDRPIAVGGSLVQRQPDGSYKPVCTPPKEPTNPCAAESTRRASVEQYTVGQGAKKPPRRGD